MGVSIHPEYGYASDIYQYLFDHQLKFAKKDKFDNFDEFVPFAKRVMKEFGAFLESDTLFIIQYNEYSDDYNPSSELRDFFNRYFNTDYASNYFAEFDLPTEPLYGCEGANADDVAEELGLILVG